MKGNSENNMTIITKKNKHYNTLSTEDKYNGINWNNINDDFDLQTFDILTSQFWTSTRIPVSNDLKNWRKADVAKREVVDLAFSGLTTLDTLQSREGSDALIAGSTTPHEIDVYNNIRYMESIHARSYSTIFTSLNPNKRVDEIFEWGSDNEHLQEKIRLLNEVYASGDHIKSKIASVYLESFLFYSGFYPALRLINEFPNVAEIIKLIIRDESVHGAYVGYKFKNQYAKMSDQEKQEIRDYAYNFLFKLYEIECKYTEDIYDRIGWTEDVKKFVEYNANKALSNLGLDQVFATTEADVNPLVIRGLSTGSVNHDFFSQVGNSYIIGKVEMPSDIDYTMIAVNSDKTQYNEVSERKVNKSRYI